MFLISLYLEEMRRSKIPDNCKINAQEEEIFNNFTKTLMKQILEMRFKNNDSKNNNYCF